MVVKLKDKVATSTQDAVITFADELIARCY